MCISLLYVLHFVTHVTKHLIITLNYLNFFIYFDISKELYRTCPMPSKGIVTITICHLHITTDHNTMQSR